MYFYMYVDLELEYTDGRPLKAESLKVKVYSIATIASLQKGKQLLRLSYV